MSLRVDLMRAWIGREIVYEGRATLDAASFRLFAMALEDDNPIHKEEAFAATTRHGGVIAPPTFICETNQIYDRAPDEAGYSGHAWDFPIEDRHFVRGGNDYKFYRPVRSGDRITATWRIAKVEEKETRNGTMIVVVSEVRYTDELGYLVATNSETILYRA